MTDPRIGTQTGDRSAGLIELREAPAGIAVHGGYLDMLPGTYRVIVWLSPAIAATGHGVIEVCAFFNQYVVRRAAFDTASLPARHPFIDLTFELFSDCKNVEVRLHGAVGLSLAIQAVEFVEISVPVASPRPTLEPPGIPGLRTSAGFPLDVVDLSPRDLAILRAPGGQHTLAAKKGSLVCAALQTTYPIVNHVPHLYHKADVSPFLERDYALFKSIHDRPDLRSPNHDAITAAYQSAKFINSDFMFSALDFAHLRERVIVELGVASCDLIRRFADAHCTCYALDYFPWEMEDALASHVAAGGMPFKCVSAVMCSLPFADASVDLVYAHAALHHALPASEADFQWSNPRNMVDCLRDIRRVLKRDGTLFLLGEGIYPDGINRAERQYERACEANPSLPYESWYTIEDYETAFRDAGMFPSLFVHQIDLKIVIALYEPSGVKHQAVTVEDGISHHNYGSLGRVLRDKVPAEVMSRVLPNWVAWR